MNTKAAPKFDFPAFDLGKFDPTKFNFEEVVSLNKANMATAFEAQRIMLDASQTLVAAHFNYLREALGNAEAAVGNIDPKAKPETYVEDAKAATEKAMEHAKNGYEVSLKAHNDVADLWNKRVNANVEEFKKFAA